MIAVRSIENVRFDVYSPGKELLYTQSTEAIATSGVMNGEDGSASLTASAHVEWQHEQAIVPGSYAVMTIKGTDDKLVVSERFPTRD